MSPARWWQELMNTWFKEKSENTQDIWTEGIISSKHLSAVQALAISTLTCVIRRTWANVVTKSPNHVWSHCRGMGQEKKVRLFTVKSHKLRLTGIWLTCSIHKGLLACTPNITYIQYIPSVSPGGVWIISFSAYTHSQYCVCVSGLLGHLWLRSAHRRKPAGCHLHPARSHLLYITNTFISHTLAPPGSYSPVEWWEVLCVKECQVSR